jgi:hypothetical protein
MFAHSKPFHPCLMFVGKARSLPKIVTFEMGFTHVDCGLTHKLGPALKKLAWDNYSSLLQEIYELQPQKHI